MKEGCCGCNSVGCCIGAVVLVAAIALLCSAGFFIAQGNQPHPPAQSYTPNQLEANQFEVAIQQASNSASQFGRFSMSVSEQQASSWLNLQAQSVTGGDVPLDNMQVRFRNGTATLYGETRAVDLTTIAMEFGVALSVSPEGTLVVNVTESNVGGVGVPGSVRSEISQQMQEAIDTELRRINGSYRLNSISTTGGLLTVSGQVVR
jgi:hypothetical protein